MSKVRVKRHQLDYFRKQARQTPYEIEAYLIGTVVSPELTVVDEFCYAPEYALQSENEVCWFREHVNALAHKAEEQGKRIVGSIHSHPRWDAVMSPADYKACISEGVRVCGICSVDNHGGKATNRRTRVRFWTLDSPLPCELVYAESSQGKKVRTHGQVSD